MHLQVSIVLLILLTGAGTKVEFISKSWSEPLQCKNWSVSTGSWRKNYAVQCCNTDFCNEQDAPGQGGVVKGCASKSACDQEFGQHIIPNDGFSCCEGNLCNGSQSVIQSFLFLCCSLLSFILLH